MSKNHYTPNILLLLNTLSILSKQNKANPSFIYKPTYLSRKYQSRVFFILSDKFTTFTKTANTYIKELHSWIGTKMSLMTQACYR